MARDERWAKPLAVLAAAVLPVVLAAGASAQTSGGSASTAPTTTGVGSQGGVGAQATPCTVTSTSSGLGTGTFRGEIAAASGGGCSDGSGNQVVTVEAGLAPITLGTAPTYSGNEPLILNGNHFTINGGANNRVLTLSTSSPATINAGTFAGGNVGNTGGAIRADGPVTLNGDTFISNTGGDGGGAVSDNHGPMVVNASSFQNNVATPVDANGGALRLHGPGHLTVTDSTFTGNRAQAGSGGAIWVDAGSTTTITGSTFMNNSTSGETESGGAVFVNLGAPSILDVSGSTFSQNVSINGGAIAAPTATVTLTNSTVTDNDAHSDGGGVAAETVQLAYADVVANSGAVGANVQIVGALTLETFGSVIADPLGGGTNCQYASPAEATSTGFNYVSDSSCFPGGGAVVAPTDLVVPGGDPQLGSLGGNGGPTQTLLPASTSPLVNVIPVAACQTSPLATGITTDQRGVSRPQGAGCDIGAVELQTSAPTPVVITPKFTG